MGFSFELTYSVCSTFWVDYLLKLKPFLFSDSDYMDTVEPQEVKDIIQLGYLWLSDKVPNQAVRYNTTNFACQIGYPKFSDALSAWK